MKATNMALRQWLDNSQFHGSVSKFASALGVPLKAVEEWFYRGVTPKSPLYRAKLYFSTGLAEYAPRSGEERDCLDKLEKAERLSAEERIGALLASLEVLRENLEYFREGSAKHREDLRVRLDGRYVAYVANLLQLMLNEDRFQEWLAMSSLVSPKQKGGWR